MTTPIQKLSSIPDVEIDEGVFKYILITVKTTNGSDSKQIVRGFKWAEYHANILDDFRAKVSNPLGLDTSCPGGGRINHQPDKKTILVYGYSQGFGKADHSIAVGMLQKLFPDYVKISFKDSGY